MQTQEGDLELLKMKWARPFSQLPSPYVSIDLHKVQVVWNQRMRTRAGVCKPHQATIELNPNVLGSIKNLEEIFIHEMCHMAVSARWPRAQSHGKRWKYLMTFFGFAPERCHALPVNKRHTHRRWKVPCSCRVHEVSTRVFNRMKHGARYRCNDCKSRLQLNLNETA